MSQTHPFNLLKVLQGWIQGQQLVTRSCIGRKKVKHWVKWQIDCFECILHWISSLYPNHDWKVCSRSWDPTVKVKFKVKFKIKFKVRKQLFQIKRQSNHLTSLCSKGQPPFNSTIAILNYIDIHSRSCVHKIIRSKSRSGKAY